MAESTLGWRHFGEQRPDFAQRSGPHQESVWDYPRPPVCMAEPREAMVVWCGHLIARSGDCLRVLETASAPGIYFPPQAVKREWLQDPRPGSVCEWKGVATYWDLVLQGRRQPRVCWSYANPSPRFTALAGWYAFHPEPLECWLGAERVQAQPGGFYGGWVTADLAGPIKGAPGTESW